VFLVAEEPEQHRFVVDMADDRVDLLTEVVQYPVSEEDMRR
jgi:hypothetical protein